MKIVITGASKGIGRALVKEFVEKEGAQVLAISRNEEQLKRLQEEIGKEQRLDILSLDITTPQLSSKVRDKYPGYLEDLDVLINNAGLLKKGGIEEVTKEDLEETYEVNLYAPYRMVQVFLGGLKKGGEGQVVNIGSMAGYMGSEKFPGMSVYGSSKAALAGLSESLAAELKPYGVTVNCLALGGVKTEMLEEAFPGNEIEVEPGEMAEMIRDLVVRGKKLINGKVLPISSSSP